MSAWILLEINAADLEKAIGEMAGAGIELHDIVKRSELTVTCRTGRHHIRTVHALAERKGWTVRILGKTGLFWQIKEILRRPILLAGLTMLLLISTFLPERILKVEVEGNIMLPDNRILEAAEESGICFWADRREVRSEKVKNVLLGKLPQLKWVGVNTYGSRAVITVREGQTGAGNTGESGVSSIVATRDGVILSTVATRGSCMVEPGQAVRAGEILISGIVDLEGIVRMTQAEGEIFAQTKRNLTVKTPDVELLRLGVEGVKHNISLLIGKKRINFYKGSGISDSSCVKMYSKYVLTLPGGFVLPLTLVKETVTVCDTAPSERAEAKVDAQMSQFVKGYLKQQMIAGMIISAEEQTVRNDGWVLNGSYECQEMIGRVKPEEIGVYNGKTD